MNSFLDQFVQKMRADNASSMAIESFQQLYHSYIHGESPHLPWQELTPLSPKDYSRQDTLSTHLSSVGESYLDQLVILKLNGGLGTSMGCSGPKSLIHVTPSYTFLDIICQQRQALNRQYQVEVPLVLMNSFNTQSETEQAISGLDHVVSFNQNRFPKVDVSTGKPFVCSRDVRKEWNPPGHGDLYLSLYTSGMLDRLLSHGKRYMFVSNSDNLGAVVNTQLFGHFLEEKSDFMMEVTPKTPQDVKGGTVVWHQDRLTLLERAQVHPDYLVSFEDLSTFPIFNTNSFWLDLQALYQLISQGPLHLPVIVNSKTVASCPVIQLEMAMGAAIHHFNRPMLVSVDRSRFLPVKKTSDLFLVRSDLFTLNEDGHVSLASPQLHMALPVVQWSDLYTMIDSFEERCRYVPSLKECRSLRIEGDVSFGPNVRLKGDVVIASDVREYLENITIDGG